MAAHVPDIEPVISALKKRLTDDLPAAITAVNATITDGTTIDAPQAILDYLPPLELLLAFPTIGIGEGPGRIEDDTGHASTGVHELSVVAFIQAADQQTLVRQLRRTRTAVLRTILDGRHLEDAVDVARNRAWGVRLKQVVPGPTLGDLQAQSVVTWWSYVRIVIECRSDSEWA